MAQGGARRAAPRAPRGEFFINN